jgi:hypothetical protein
MPGAGRTARPLLQARSPGERDGGVRLAAGAGDGAAAVARAVRRQALRQRATLPPPSGETPASRTRLRREPPPVQRFPLVSFALTPGARPRPDGLARPAGVPLKLY